MLINTAVELTFGPVLHDNHRFLNAATAEEGVVAARYTSGVVAEEPVRPEGADPIVAVSAPSGAGRLRLASRLVNQAFYLLKRKLTERDSAGEGR